MNLDDNRTPVPNSAFDRIEHSRQLISLARDSLPVLIIQTGTALPHLRARHRDFPHWFRTGLKLHARHVVVTHVERGEKLPDARRFGAAIITGSGAMVTDRHDWSERTAEWLRSAMQQQLPLFGVCYGHQLMAHALGGEVGYNPRGREMGTIDIDAHDAARSDDLFGPLGSRFRAHATHLQSVLKPPRDAVVLARSALEDCHALRYSRRAWSVQFHPEFSTHAMRGYIHKRTPELNREGLDADALLGSVKPCPDARRLLRRFLRLARN